MEYPFITNRGLEKTREKCEGAGAALRTYLHGFRGVHKQYLDRYVATFEAMANAKRFTPALLRQMCLI
jgi:hypothetical protein